MIYYFILVFREWGWCGFYVFIMFKKRWFILGGVRLKLGFFWVWMLLFMSRGVVLVIFGSFLGMIGFEGSRYERELFVVLEFLEVLIYRIFF